MNTPRHPIIQHNVRVLMDRFDEDQSKFADRLNVSQSTISKWGNSSEPRGASLMALAKLAKVSIEDFLTKKLPEVRNKGSRDREKLALPSEDRLRVMFRGMLLALGLDEVADEHADELARRLPSALEHAGAQLAPPASVDATRADAHLQPYVKRDRGLM